MIKIRQILAPYENDFIKSIAFVEEKSKNLFSNLHFDIEQQKELLKIEAIYRKYNPNSDYSPIGHGATDITDGKVGCFFDGLPIHSTGYANLPQWFNYLCGKSYVYFENIPEDQRNGYDKLFNDIISGTVNPIKNCCCKKKISPDKLSFVDLSPILPLSEKDDINISQNDNLVKTDDDYERQMLIYY